MGAPHLCGARAAVYARPVSGRWHATLGRGRRVAGPRAHRACAPISSAHLVTWQHLRRASVCAVLCTLLFEPQLHPRIRALQVEGAQCTSALAQSPRAILTMPFVLHGAGALAGLIGEIASAFEQPTKAPASHGASSPTKPPSQAQQQPAGALLEPAAPLAASTPRDLGGAGMLDALAALATPAAALQGHTDAPPPSA